MTEARIKSNIVIVWLHELVSLVFEQEKRGKKINGERERQQKGLERSLQPATTMLVSQRLSLPADC